MGGGGGGSIPSSDLKKLEEKAKQTLATPADTGCHVFISFAFEDEDAVNLLRGQAKNEKSELEFDDFSLKQAVNSENEDYIGSSSFRVEPNSHNDSWSSSPVGMCAGRWPACAHVHEACLIRRMSPWALP